MKYMIHEHKKKPDDPDVLHALGDMPGGFFADYDLAVHALVMLVDASELDDYVVLPHDDAGILLEKVGEAEGKKIADDAQWLIQNNVEARSILVALVAARQLYAMAVSATTKLIEGITKIGNEKRPPTPGVAEFMVQSAAAHAAKPFEEVTLVEGLDQSVIPWMQATISSHVAADHADKQKKVQEIEEQRRNTLLPIGFKCDRERPVGLDRKIPVILIGYGPAIRYLLQLAKRTTLANPSFNVIEIGGTRVQKFDLKFVAEGRLNVVPKNNFRAAASSKKRLLRAVSNFIQPYWQNKRPDLLLIEDLAWAGIDPIVSIESGGIGPYNAADALKHLKPWCEHSGIGLLAGMSSPNMQPIDLHDAAWDRLKEHALLCAVTITQDVSTVSIHIGTNSDTLTVDASDFVSESLILT